MKIELDEIQIMSNAQFYRLNKQLSKNIITETFSKIKKLKGATSIPIKDNIRNNSRRKDIFISAFVYYNDKKPSFIKHVRLMERKYSYIVLLEINDILVVSKLNAPDITKYFGKHISYLEYETICNVFSSDDPIFNKVNTTSTSIIDTGIRNAKYEGINLKFSMNSYGVKQSIPTSFNVQTNDNKFNDNLINPSTRRVKTKSQRNDLMEFARWSEQVIFKLNKPKKTSFLDSFSSPVNYSKVNEKKLQPTGLLLKTDALESKLYSNDSNMSLRYKKKHNSYIKIQLHKYKDVLYNARYSLLIDNFKTEFNSEEIRIKYDKESVKLESDFFSKIYLCNDDTNSKQSMRSFFNNKGEFIVIFDDPKYIFLKNQLFYDKGILDNIDSLMKIFDPNSHLENVTNEKLYNDKVTDHAITSFDTNTLFNVVETNIFNNKGHLICDDLGDEWADHITFVNDKKLPEITFYISKHGETSTKASSLHDVLGQVSKNIGNIRFDKDMIVDKIRLWKNANWSGTNIKRIRSSNHDWDDIYADIEDIISNPKVTRTLCVVTTLLSAKQLKDELNDFKTGDNKRKHLPQLMWFLSSFVNACMINNIKPKIICKN